MVDFRYHLVSIIAVFLALAVGIVVGTTALNGAVLDDLQDRVAGLTRDKRDLEGDLRAAQERGSEREQAVTLLAAEVVGGRLPGQRIVLVSGPDAPPEAAEELTPLLQEAGATVAVQVQLLPALFDPANRALLTDLVARSALPGLPLPEGEPVEQALTQLGQVLGVPAEAEPLRPQDVQRVLAAYEGANLIEVTGEPEAGGSLGVVLVGPRPPGSVAPADPENPGAAEPQREQQAALVGLARALDARSQGVVVAGPPSAAEERGVLQAVRDDAEATTAVSTVGGVESATGRLAVVLALAEQRDGGVGAYGAGPGDEPALPDPTTP